MKLKDASSVTVTYPAEAVFSLVDGPYSSDCKYAKMNQTLTATYSSWNDRVDDLYSIAVSPKKQYK